MDKLERLAALLETANQDYTSPQEVAEVIAVVIEQIKENKDLTDEEIASVKEAIREVVKTFATRIDEVRDTVAQDRKSTALEIKNIKLKPGPKGDKGDSIKGDPGRDGKDGKDGKDGRDGRDAVLDTKRLDDIERMAKANAHALPVTTTNFFKDGTLIGRAKNINIVEGTNADISVSIVGDQANIIISTTGGGGGGANVDTETVTATDAGGNNVNIDLTQLSQPWTAVMFVARNGSIQDKSKWSIVGNTLTLTGAVSTNSFQVQYTY